jgi:hypothetical protein
MEDKSLILDDEEKEEKRSSTLNRAESLLVVYVLRILKEYSAPDKALTADDVITHLKSSKKRSSLK